MRAPHMIASLSFLPRLVRTAVEVQGILEQLSAVKEPPGSRRRAIVKTRRGRSKRGETSLKIALIGAGIGGAGRDAEGAAGNVQRVARDRQAVDRRAAGEGDGDAAGLVDHDVVAGLRHHAGGLEDDIG